MTRQNKTLITTEGLQTYLICPRAWYTTEGQGNSQAADYIEAHQIIQSRKKLSDRLALAGSGAIVVGTLIFVVSLLLA